MKAFAHKNNKYFASMYGTNMGVNPKFTDLNCKFILNELKRVSKYP